MIRKMLNISLLLVLVFVLAACGGDGDDDGGNGGDSGVDLSQSFSAADPASGLTLNFSYPEGWTTDENNLGVANSEDVLTAANEENPTFEGEDIAVLFLPISAEMGSAIGVAEDAGPADVVALVTDLIFADAETDLSDVEDFDAGDNSGAITSGSATVDGVESNGTIAVIGTGDGNFVAVVGRYGDDANGVATVRAIAETVATE